jgi:hypothetical protein
MIAMPNTPMLDKSGSDSSIMAEQAIELVAAETESGACKILLPRRAGEPKFAPPQYYYPASPSGVMPSWRSAA